MTKRSKSRSLTQLVHEQAATIDRLASDIERLLAANRNHHVQSGRTSRSDRRAHSYRSFTSLEYDDAIRKLRAVVRKHTRDGSRLLVVTRGDPALLRGFGARVAEHFPQLGKGRYAGFYPADDREAIDALEKLESARFDYICFPAPAIWWLDHYIGLRRYLDYTGTLVHWCRDTGIIYSLSNAVDTVDAAAIRGRLVEDYNAGVHHQLGAESEGDTAGDGTLYEALLRAELRNFLDTGTRLRLCPPTNPGVSVVIPVHNKAYYTYRALTALAAGSNSSEIIIVDNASTDETAGLLARVEGVVVVRMDANTGFGVACNAGADHARAPAICFLNNDTVVPPGGIDQLTATLMTSAEVGAVGPKLVHPHGRLQEAGGIIWADGSNWGYGRGGEPGAPGVAYVRDVDYCSAACLVVKTRTFRAVGGFDDRYAPAYYEDLDLCCAIWAQGQRVVCDGRVSVGHVEFGSSGTTEAIQLQLRNRERFTEKWAPLLATRPAPAESEVVRARDRRPGPRVLVVDDRVPRPEFGAGFPRAHEILRALTDLGCVVSFLPTDVRLPSADDVSRLVQDGVEILWGPEEIETLLAERATLYKVAFVSRPHNARYVEAVRRHNPQARVIYDAEAVSAVREVLARRARGRPVSDSRAMGLVRAEVQLSSAADAVTAVSMREADYFRSAYPTKPIFVLGELLASRDAPGPRGRRDMLFVGNLATEPNIDAVEWLMRDVMPRFERKDRRLVIVGAQSDALTARLKRLPTNVVIAGFVQELAPIYDSARVFVAPHRFAAGVPHKVVEAMAHGLPCLVSALLAEQLEVEHGREAIVCDGPDEYVNWVDRLHFDHRAWRRLQANAWQLVERRHGRQAGRRILAAAIAAAAPSP